MLIAGVIAMGYQTVQTRHSIKDLAPRLVVGFLAGALSLWAATQGIRIANALAQAVMGGGVDAANRWSGPATRSRTRSWARSPAGSGSSSWASSSPGCWCVLLITYVVRVALTLVLIAGAPFVLMFHALPQTEGIAYWWWKAFGGCLAIQVGQSLALITAVAGVLRPGRVHHVRTRPPRVWSTCCSRWRLLYILFKIPFWVLSSLRGGGGRRGLIGRWCGASSPTRPSACSADAPVAWWRQECRIQRAERRRTPLTAR